MVDLMVRSENIGYHEENWNERIYDESMGGKGELDNMPPNIYPLALG